MRFVLVGDLKPMADQYEGVAVRCVSDMAHVVEKNAKDGNRKAQASARITSGTHGIHYPDSMRATKDSAFSWTYGPSRAFGPQGGMLFENGEGRQSTPHRDLARSLEVQGPLFRADVRALPASYYP